MASKINQYINLVLTHQLSHFIVRQAGNTSPVVGIPLQALRNFVSFDVVVIAKYLEILMYMVCEYRFDKIGYGMITEVR